MLSTCPFEIIKMLWTSTASSTNFKNINNLQEQHLLNKYQNLLVSLNKYPRFYIIANQIKHKDDVKTITKYPMEMYTVKTLVKSYPSQIVPKSNCTHFGQFVHVNKSIRTHAKSTRTNIFKFICLYMYDIYLRL